MAASISRCLEFRKTTKATGSTFAGFKIINFHNCFRNTYNDFSEIRELKSLFLKKCLYIFPIFIFKDDLCVTVMASQTVLAWPALPPLPTRSGHCGPPAPLLHARRRHRPSLEIRSEKRKKIYNIPDFPRVVFLNTLYA